MGRKTKVLPQPKELRFVMKSREELEPLLLAEIERLRVAFEQGQRKVLLDAIDLALRHFLPGSWVPEEWAWIVDAWEAGEISSLDEFLGLTSNKGKVEAHRVQIISAITNRRRQGMPRDQAFQEVAKLFGAGKSTIGKMYDANPRLRTVIENLPTLLFRPRVPRFASPSRFRRSKLDSQRR